MSIELEKMVLYLRLKNKPPVYDWLSAMPFLESLSMPESSKTFSLGGWLSAMFPSLLSSMIAFVLFSAILPLA
jgi:hypothetical protein